MFSFGFITGVGTKIDPMLCRADRMVGQVLGAVNALPDIYTEITISFFLLRRLLGVKTEGDKKGAKVKCPSFILEGGGCQNSLLQKILFYQNILP